MRKGGQIGAALLWGDPRNRDSILTRVCGTLGCCALRGDLSNWWKPEFKNYSFDSNVYPAYIAPRLRLGGVMRPLSLVRASVLILLLGFMLQSARAQTPAPSPPPPVQDPQAIAAIQSAIAATGGIAAISAIQSSIAQGTSVVSPDDGSGTTNFTWTHSGQDFRYENDATSGNHVFVSNSGNPCDIEAGIVVASAPYVARANLPFHIPALVLFNELNNPNYTLTYVGATTLNGTSAIHIQTADNSDSVGQLVTPQDWYFDATTSLPLSVQYRIPSPRDPQIWYPGSITFANFQTVNGVLVPFQLTIQEGPPAVPAAVATISSVTFNIAISSTQCVASSVAGGAQ